MFCVCPKISNYMYFMVLGRKLKDLGEDAIPLSFSSFKLWLWKKMIPTENETLTLKGGQRWEFDLLCLTEEIESLKIRISSHLPSERAEKRTGSQEASPRAVQGGLGECITPNVRGSREAAGKKWESPPEFNSLGITALRDPPLQSARTKGTEVTAEEEAAPSWLSMLSLLLWEGKEDSDSYTPQFLGTCSEQ